MKKKILTKILFCIFGLGTLALSSCDILQYLNVVMNNEELQTYSLKLTKSSIVLNLNGQDSFDLNSICVTNISDIDKYISWSIEDESICSITDGILYAKKVGETKITAYLVEQESTKAECVVSVLDEKPTYSGITLSDSSINIDLNDNNVFTISYLVLGSNSPSQNVNWTYSTEYLSAVEGINSMTFTALKCGTTKIKVCSTENTNIYGECTVTITDSSSTNPTTKYDCTIMIYMCASTLENESYGRPGGGHSSGGPALFTGDIKELLSVKNIPDSVKIIIETGGTTKWYLDSSYLSGATSISNKYLQRWEVSDNKLKLISTLTTNEMASQSSFESFLKWGLTDYSASQMGVVISGHGAGIDGCAFDDNYTYNYEGSSYEHSLGTNEVALAAKNALQTSSRDKFTWIGYDACLMGVADIASVNSDYFEYMIASQESEAGEGWDHDSYLPLLVNNPKVEPKVLLDKIASTFVSYVHSSECSSREPCYQTQAVYDLSYMDEFVNEFNSYVGKLGNSTQTYSKIVSAFSSSYEYGEGVYGLADFDDFMNNMSTKFSNISVDGVLNALDKLVISNYYCNRYGSKEPCGVCVFLPYTEDTYYGLQVGECDYTGEYQTKFTNWQTLCLQYGEWGW